jgi:four helix bundle protein
MAYNQTDNPVLKFSFDFAISILKLTDELEGNRKYTVSKQLSRSGTSIGANIFEAQSAESRADFIHKLKIAAKEAEETRYWLMICLEMEYIKDKKLLDDLEVICKLLSKIISTTKSKIYN